MAKCQYIQRFRAPVMDSWSLSRSVIKSVHKYGSHLYEGVKFLVSTGQVFVQVAPSLHVWREKHITQHGMTRVERRMNKLCGGRRWQVKKEGGLVGQSDGPCQMETHNCWMAGNTWTFGQEKSCFWVHLIFHLFFQEARKIAGVSVLAWGKGQLGNG